jgi:hypothetical protein
VSAVYSFLKKPKSPHARHPASLLEHLSLNTGYVVIVALVFLTYMAPTMYGLVTATGGDDCSLPSMRVIFSCTNLTLKITTSTKAAKELLVFLDVILLVLITICSCNSFDKEQRGFMKIYGDQKGKELWRQAGLHYFTIASVFIIALLAISLVRWHWLFYSGLLFALYFVYLLANIRIVRLLRDNFVTPADKGDRDHVIKKKFFDEFFVSNIALTREENLPAFVGYSILLSVSCLVFWVSGFLVQGSREPLNEVAEFGKIFIAGAASIHLAVSATRFAHIISWHEGSALLKKDTLDVVMSHDDMPDLKRSGKIYRLATSVLRAVPYTLWRSSINLFYVIVLCLVSQLAISVLRWTEKHQTLILIRFYSFEATPTPFPFSQLSPSSPPSANLSKFANKNIAATRPPVISLTASSMAETRSGDLVTNNTLKLPHPNRSRICRSAWAWA